jgi:hypothetical protein
VLLAHLNARAGFDGHGVEMERDVSLRLGRLARVEGVQHCASRVPRQSRQQSA